MSRFKRIKNKSNKKSSVSIDEKIAALNKELEKTGMSNVSEMMTTSNIYPQTSEVPNEVFNDFEAITQGGYGIGLSGADGNGAGGAIIQTVPAGQNFAGLEGVAYSPPHPVTGLRTNAFTITDGTGSSHPLVPGSNSGGNYLRGGALWFFDSNYNFAGQQGRWLNFEWSTQHNSWAFWDTNFLGFFFLNPNLDQYELNGVNIGTQIKNKIAGINFSGNGEIGPPKNILITQRGIGDIEYHGPITPGRLFGLSDQGYNYLDNKSRRRLRGRTVYRTSGGGAYPTTGRTTTFTTGSRLRSAQPIADPTTTTQTQQSPPEESEPPNIPAPQSSPDKPFSTSNPTPPPDIPPLPAPKPQPGNYEGRPGRILDPTGLDQRAIELGYNDELYPVNPDRFYTTQVELGQDILSSLMNAEFYSAASRGESPNYNNAEINKAKADLAKYRKNLDNWNRWKQNTGYTWKGAVSDREYDKQKALEKELKDKELDKQIDQLEKDKAQNEADAEAAATEARNLIAQFGLEVALTLFGPGILKLAGNALGKLPAVAKFFKLSKAAQKAQIDDALKAAKKAADPADDILDALKDTLKGRSKLPTAGADDFIDFINSDLMGRNISRAIKAGKKNIVIPYKGKNVSVSVDKLQQFRFKGPNYQQLFQSHKLEGKLLNEAIKLGHFEPEELNVDIEKLRKGIMPEYPKKPPAKMVDGYHQDSKLKPKELNKEPYLKIDEKDLIRNHRLKPNEAQEMMQTIDRINDHIKKHPEDLIHAQMRYPIDDPRLAELNWRMDQMLDAGEEYLDTNFKENKKLFNRAVDRTKKNIKLTDPEYVQQHYDELRGTPKPKKTKLVGRLSKYLNKYESKSLFKHVNSKDFKKISERKLEKEKFLEKQEQERLDYINDINAEMDEFRSDWRNELKEQPAFKAVPIDTGKMTSSQSFAVFPNFPGSSDTGIRLDLDGGLGRDNSLANTDAGLEDPNFTGIFQFPTEAGGFVPAINFRAGGEINSAQINYGDFPLSGYAMPLGGDMYRSITQRKKEEINKELDSSEEYTKQIKADALMKARVEDGPTVVKIYKASDFTPGEGLADRYPPEQLQKLSVQNPQKFSEYKHIFDIADEMAKKVETSFEKIDQEYSDQWEPKLSSLLPSNQYSDLYKKHGGSAFSEVNIEINRLYNEEQKAMTRVKTKDGIRLRSNKKSRAIRATANKISDAIPILQELQNKLDDIRQSKMDVVEAENRRETKALQKAAPEFFFPHGELKPLDLYMEPFGADLKTMSDIEKYASEPTTNIVSQEDEEWLNSQSTLVDFLQYLKPFGIPSDFGKFGIQYARGDDTPIRKFSGGMNKALEGIFIKKYKKNPKLFENGKKVRFSYKDYGTGEGATIIQKGIDALRYPNIRLGLGTFVMSVDSNGVIRVEDTFNVDKLFTTVGAFDVFDLQNSANRITKIAHQRRGVVGDDDKGGIPVDVKFRSLKMKKLLQKKDK